MRDWTFLPWREMTRKERALTVVINLLGSVIIVVLFVGILFIVGMIVESNVQHHEEHDRCLRDATNGLEIKQCR